MQLGFVYCAPNPTHPILAFQKLQTPMGSEFDPEVKRSQVNLGSSVKQVCKISQSQFYIPRLGQSFLGSGKDFKVFLTWPS